MIKMHGLARTAALGLTLAMTCAGGAQAGIIGPDPALKPAPGVIAVQYGYGYGYRPYYRPYPGYGFYARRRYYNNHFGPGAAKERYRTDLTFCRSQPSRC